VRLTRAWRRLRSLDRGQWRIVGMSLVLLPLVSLGLRSRGFRWTSSWLARWSDAPAREPSLRASRAAAEAVALVAGRRVVGARCLGRSLVLWAALRRRGVDAELVVGAQAPERGVLPAHAWVEVLGVPVNDAADVRERFGSFAVALPRLAHPLGS
jgi:hypothetical protein